MAPTRRQLLGSTGTVLVLAGCLGDEDGDGSDGAESTDGDDSSDGNDGSGDDGTDENETETMDDGNATVRVREHDEYGDILVGPDGMTLYNFDSDEQGADESTCYDGCAESWPPVTVDEEPTVGDGVDAEVTAFEREDGEMQVAVNGWPLYYFASDEEPGDASGQAINDVWWVMAPDGTPIRDRGEDGDHEHATVRVREHDEYGEILVGPDGMTLYNFDSDEQGAGESTCYDGCAENWPPLAVADEPVAGDAVTAELTTFEREDGEVQVAVNGWPLYYFASDEEPGDASGQAINDVWWVMAPDGTPIRGDDAGDDGMNDY